MPPGFPWQWPEPRASACPGEPGPPPALRVGAPGETVWLLQVLCVSRELGGTRAFIEQGPRELNTHPALLQPQSSSGRKEPLLSPRYARRSQGSER